METKIQKTVYFLFLVLLSCFVEANSTRAQDPVGWWKLDDGTGKTAIDSSGKGNNGTVQGDGKWTEGKIGGAIQFNGKDTSISAPHIPLENHSFTVMMWINPTELTGLHTFFSQGGAQGPRGGQTANNSLVHLRLCGKTVAEGQGVVYGIRFAFWYNDLDTSPNIIQTDTWYHVAGVYDYEKKVRRIYIDGVQMAQDTDVSPYISTTGNTFLGSENNARNRYNGILDDVRIYNRALTKAEIQEIASSSGNAQFQGMYNNLEEAKKLLKGQKSQQAKSLLEKEISKYEQFKKTPVKNISFYEPLACEMYYLHGAACEAIGDKKNTNIIADDYKKTLLVDTISEENIQGTALLWLFQNANTDYNNVVNSLLKNNGHYLQAVVLKAKDMISNRQAPAAIKFIEGNIASYTQWQKDNPYIKVIAEDMLPGVYFQLAKAKETAKLPIKEIAETYGNTFIPSSSDYVTDRAEALAWLIKNERTEELTKAIKSFTQEQDIKTGFKNIVSNVCKQFESDKDGEGFQRFLKSLFTTAKFPADWATFVESCLTDKTSRFAKVFYDSLEKNTKIQFSYDLNKADKLVTAEKYKEAAELYTNLLTRCGPEDNKGELEFKLCKCLFDGGSYSEALTKLNSFIASNYKDTHRNRVKEAMLMKGRTLIQLGEVDKAIDAFSSVTIEYPETKEMPETTFFVGYCYMLKSKFTQASEAFEIVTKSYPDSSYANQAKLLLTRIKEMNK